ncbi:hypothetical protein [Yokenella regensburgei]|uniref:hypothetical protein n=1 Tax=Yokenella regensburgei TaxID=158877 RepID=UPI001375CC1D|nr:hypothetical protein [Yokenella regensburgei]KAF1366266.1 hypothetical protein FHR25_005266 [Yokenella regensburgei]
MATETEKELANVVMFPVKDVDPIDYVGYIHERGELCHHPGIYVNEKERLCRCKKCGATIDPFDYLLSVAKRETRLAGNVKALREEERYRRENIAKLIQIERNAKARIRRAQRAK